MTFLIWFDLSLLRDDTVDDDDGVVGRGDGSVGKDGDEIDVYEGDVNAEDKEVPVTLKSWLLLLYWNSFSNSKIKNKNYSEYNKS